MTTLAGADVSCPRRRATRREHLVQMRLARVDGQVRGVAGMVAAGRPCTDVLDQLAAAAAALDSVALLVLEDHVDGCLSQAVTPAHADELAELTGAVRRYLRRR